MITASCEIDGEQKICANKERINGAFSDVGILGIVGFSLILVGTCCRVLQICGDGCNCGAPSGRMLESMGVICAIFCVVLHPTLLIIFGSVYASASAKLIDQTSDTYDYLSVLDEKGDLDEAGVNTYH